MVFAKMLYDSGKIEHINYQIYLNWFDTFSEEFPVHKIVYVKTLPENCHSRIMKRARDGEANIPLDYLNSCNEYHNHMLDTSTNDCVCHHQLVLDGNIDIYEKETPLTLEERKLLANPLNIYNDSLVIVYNKLKAIPGHEHDCGRTGVNGGFIANPNVKFGVNCYGYKPKITNEEEELMKTSSPYPETVKDVAFQKQVDHWKNKVDEILVSPFNYSSWGSF